MLNFADTEVTSFSQISPLGETSTGISEISLIQQFYLPHMKNLFKESYRGLPNPDELI